MVDLLPNRQQARQLVISLAVFWSAWAVAVVGFDIAPALGPPAFLVGFVAVFRFYLTLFRVWEPESSESAWRMMFVPSFRRSRMRASLHLFDLFRPSWIRQTLRATGWPPKVVGSGLLALLVADSVVAITVFPQAFGGS